MPTLQISLPDGEQTHELTEDVTTIGRVSDNTIHIDDGSVSSHHAQITLRDGQYELEDLDSTNGTRVNDQRQSKIMLVHGMRVRFGQVDAVYMSEADGESRPLPEADEIGVKVGDQTKRPADFTNSSPFGRRSGKKDGAGALVLAFAILVMLLACGAIYMAYSIQAPVA
ncbi:MAG TPA: FHA domain-containing protein [Chthoniobacterales bacterium]|jgi:pSer/pThr/pTyr-binding forkhead associated (FHA) protein